MSNSFIPKSFEPPVVYQTEAFYFRVLDTSIAKMDYDAVMSSQTQLQGIFGPCDNWPNSNMTLAENIASLKIHQQEFKSRQAFAYSILNSDKSRCLGSVYIDPSNAIHYDCEIYFWIRADSKQLENILYQTIQSWLTEKWPFTKPAFPGRQINWRAWAKELKREGTSFSK